MPWANACSSVRVPERAEPGASQANREPGMGRISSWDLLGCKGEKPTQAPGGRRGFLRLQLYCPILVRAHLPAPWSWAGSTLKANPSRHIWNLPRAASSSSQKLPGSFRIPVPDPGVGGIRLALLQSGVPCPFGLSWRTGT